MHDDEADVDAELVARLVRGQFPQWGGLPVVRLASGGTVNAVFRLGDELTVRLPLTGGGAKDVAWESRWLPVLGPALPVPIPTVVATGEPGEGYPYPWSIHRWIDGTTPVEGTLVRPEEVARDLAAFVTALREVDPAGAPVAYRGGPLSEIDRALRLAVGELGRTPEPFDCGAILASWEESLTAAPWSGEPRWVHADLMPGNLLLRDDRLGAVLDFACAGVGDPACDLMPGWNLFHAPARKVFRESLDPDEDTWLRGRGWALAQAVIALPYYRRTNLMMSATARHVLRQVLS